jgi:hypothetical protein
MRWSDLELGNELPLVCQLTTTIPHIAHTGPDASAQLLRAGTVAPYQFVKECT